MRNNFIFKSVKIQSTLKKLTFKTFYFKKIEPSCEKSQLP